MRVLLAAITCEKGDLEANLAAHANVLAEADAARCDLAVFPEYSLTGSVDPERHPERAVPLDGGAVQRVVDLSRDHQVAALFGIGERLGDRFHVTQVYAAGGEVLGVQRKRHLPDDERAFTASADTALFRLGSARLGSIICAEARVDFTWDATAAAGAELVCFTSAPGLDGRRTDEAAWRAGFEWWEGCGLGDARRHAARLGVWVAMATQAGSVADEGFPGIAALVAPGGDVVARLPDWRPGTLVVDVPIDVAVPPERTAVRILVVDEAGRAALVEYADDDTGHRWWVPPGGGVEPGEDDLATARRELREELGREDLVVGQRIGGRRHTFRMNGRWLTQAERWYLCRCRHFDPGPALTAGAVAEGIRSVRWWSADELRAAAADTGPRQLAALLDGIAAGAVPAADADLGI